MYQTKALSDEILKALLFTAASVDGCGAAGKGLNSYELSVYVNGVYCPFLAVVSDRKLGVSLNSSTVDHYNAVIVNV